MSSTDNTETPRNIVYGVPAIAREINEPNQRRVYYMLEKGYVPGAWKAGNIWALTIPAFRRAVGLDA
jgi:hypothetical protein